MASPNPGPICAPKIWVPLVYSIAATAVQTLWLQYIANNISFKLLDGNGRRCFSMKASKSIIIFVSSELSSDVKWSVTCILLSCSADWHRRIGDRQTDETHMSSSQCVLSVAYFPGHSVAPYCKLLFATYISLIPWVPVAPLETSPLVTTARSQTLWSISPTSPQTIYVIVGLRDVNRVSFIELLSETRRQDCNSI
jgi:hypothetical protein